MECHSQIVDGQRPDIASRAHANSEDLDMEAYVQRIMFVTLVMKREAHCFSHGRQRGIGQPSWCGVVASAGRLLMVARTSTAMTLTLALVVRVPVVEARTRCF